MSIPKPKHCGQNWLDMKPAEGGRICGGCNKLIVDFTKSNWREIEEVQAANNNAVCGMYTDKQLQHWGQQPPAASCSKIAASLALFASLASVMPASAQQDTTKVRTVVHGKIVDEDGAPLEGVYVFLDKTNYWVISSADGNYSIDVTNYIDTLDRPVLRCKSAGRHAEIHIPQRRGDIVSHVVLPYPKIEVFYVYQPTYTDRVAQLTDSVLKVLKRKKK